MVTTTDQNVHRKLGYAINHFATKLRNPSVDQQDLLLGLAWLLASMANDDKKGNPDDFIDKFADIAKNNARTLRQENSN